MLLIIELGHEKTCRMSYANNKGADQPAHPRILISAFVVRCLDSVMSLITVTKISCLRLTSVAEQGGLSLTWSETPEDTFSHDEAQILSVHLYRIPRVSLFSYSLGPTTHKSAISCLTSHTFKHEYV